MAANIQTSYNQFYKGPEPPKRRGPDADRRGASANRVQGSAGGITDSGDVKSTGESQLSPKAQSFLNNLRQQYGNYDFFVAGAGDNVKGLMSQSSKEFSVSFSNEELERMADDPDYAAEMMDHMQKAVDMSRELDARYGLDNNPGGLGAGGNRSILTSLSVSVDKDGIASIFAELDKIAEKQKEYTSVKKTSVQADSVEAFSEKLASIDWDKIPGKKAV